MKGSVCRIGAKEEEEYRRSHHRCQAPKTFTRQALPLFVKIPAVTVV